MERDDSDISKAYGFFHKLLEIQGLNSIELSIFNSRRSQLITTVVTHAHLLDPRNACLGPSEDELLEFENCIGDTHRNEILAYMEYCANNQITFPHTLLTWWNLFGVKKFPNLKIYAVKILSIKTSSAASERAWSIFKWIHSSKRSSLTDEHIEQLIFIYMNQDIKEDLEFGIAEPSDSDLIVNPTFEGYLPDYLNFYSLSE